RATHKPEISLTHALNPRLATEYGDLASLARRLLSPSQPMFSWRLCIMDSTVVTALAAALGSLAGATVSVGTTWLTQRRQSIRATAEWKLRERESLYKEFLMEASRLFGDAMVNSLDRPDQLVAMYGILNRIRLISGDDVLSKAVEICHRIVGLYRRPNLTAE